MRFVNIALILIVSFGVVDLASVAEAQTKHDKSAAKERCPDEKTYTGKYRNWSYGFSIVIPAKWKAFWNSARCVPDDKYGCICMSDHGRTIELTDDSYIEAYAGFDVLEWTFAEHEQSDIEYLTEEKGVERVERVRSGETKLGKLRAGTYLLKFVKNGKAFFKERIIAVHDGVEYTLTLRTSEDNYQQDKRDFEQVLVSWKLTKRAE